MFENARKSLIQHSSVFILSGQKLIKNAKKSQFWRFFCNHEACGHTVLPDRSLLIRYKLVENAKNYETFWVIFKHCVNATREKSTEKS